MLYFTVVIRLKKPFILLVGALSSFILATQIQNLFFIPDLTLSAIPIILSPLIIAFILVSKTSAVKDIEEEIQTLKHNEYQMIAITILVPFIIIILGYYLFAFVLRNLR